MVPVLAVALALDAVAVTASLGAARRPVGTLVAAAVLFGLFQAGMAGLGAWGGAWVAQVASAWDHWIAFALLALVGGRMILEDDEGDDLDEETASHAGLAELLALAVATSIDALAAGTSLPLLDTPVLQALGIVGLVTLILSLGGAFAGRAVGAHLGGAVERVGGVVLVLIGLRIVASHEGWWG